MTSIRNPQPEVVTRLESYADEPAFEIARSPTGCVSPGVGTVRSRT